MTDDRKTTIIKPNPGGRLSSDRTVIQSTGPDAPGQTPANTPQPQANLSVPSAQGAQDALNERQEDNPLVAAAGELLVLVGKLRTQPHVDNLASLKNLVIDRLNAYDNRASALGVDQQERKSAHYMLCTFIDEAVLNTAWGSASEWGMQPVLAMYHHQASGGETFFQIVETCLAQPDRYLDLLEFAYLCLSLGFEGRYRLHDQPALEAVRDRVYRALADRAGGVGSTLSDHWRGEDTAAAPLAKAVPLWVACTLAGVVLIACFLWLWIPLGDRAGELDAVLSGVGLEPLGVPSAVYEPAAPDRVSLQDLLAEPAAQGLITIDAQDPRVTTVTISHPDLFASGEAAFGPSYEPLFAAIGTALERLQGIVVVEGHTDDVPIRSLRYPNNVALSRARAASVGNALRRQLSTPTRVAVVGRGATARLQCSDEPNACRAKDRRVVIVHR